MSQEIEREISQNTEIRWSNIDMLKAFRHGREFEQVEGAGELCSDAPDKNLPFWEWLSRYYGNQPSVEADAEGRCQFCSKWEKQGHAICNWCGRILRTA